MDLAYTASQEPYPGLRSFWKSESDIFFGRDDHIDEIIAKLADHHFLCITGASGCGKSSLARTGLMNHLEAGFLPGRGSDWIFCDLTPGDRPIDTLFRTLADAIVAEVKSNDEAVDLERRTQIGDLFYHHIATQRRSSDLNKVLGLIKGIEDRPIMIMVDQFEELFRYALSDSDAAANFVEILLQSAAAARAVYVVITIRTDELEKCSRYPGLTRRINESQFLTPVLDRYQIQEAVEGPIALWNGKISPTFCTWLLNCLEEELDKLPLMQHALKLLYTAKCLAEDRRDVTIDVDDFIRVFELPPDLDLSSPEGRLALRSSLSDRLTQRYNELPDRLKPGTRRAFCALTAIESENRDIRQPRKLGALADIIGESVPDTRAIVRAFSTGDEAYLRCKPELGEADTVDVTHECILRLWSQLQTEWLADEKKSADNIMLLAGLARHWDNSSEQLSLFSRFFSPAVLKGYTRERYQHWFDTAHPTPAWAARYLGKVDWPAPSRGPRQRLLPGEIFERIKALLNASRQHRNRVWVASALAAVAIVGLIFRLEELQRTTMRQAQSEADRITTSGLAPEETRIANLKEASQAFRDGLSGYGAIWATLQQVYELYRFQDGDTVQGQVHAADFAADGKSVLAIDLGGVLHQWALTPEHKVVRQFPVGPLADDGVAAQGRSLKVSPSGDVAAIGFNDGSVVLVDLTTAAPRTVALQIDGGKPHASRNPQRRSVFKLAFSPDGSLLVTSGLGGNVAIWQQSPPGPPGQAPGNDPLQWTLKQNINLNGNRPAAIWSVDIDEAKQTIAAGLEDGRVCLVWLDRPDQPVCSADGHARGKTVKAVRFLRGQPILVSAGNDARVSIWNVDSAARHFNPGAIPLYQDNQIWDIDVSRDGALLATASWDGSIRVYRTNTWRLLNTMAADKVAWTRREGRTVDLSDDSSISLRTVRFDPSSSMLVTSSLDHTARVWTPLLDRTSILDLSYRLSTATAGSVQPITSVALEATGDRIAFTDTAGVYVRSAAEGLKPLPVDREQQPPGQTQPFHFSQVLIPFKDEVVASAVEPRLAVWTKSAGGEWIQRTVDLPGDPIKADRSMAFDAAHSRLAVAVQEGDRTSILLCPLQDARGDWTCSSTDSSVAPALALDIDRTPNGCATSGSQVMIAISKSGRLIAAGAGHCPIQVFDSENPKTAPRSYNEATWAEQAHDPLSLPPVTLTSLDFSPDEKTFVSAASGRPEVRLWNLADGNSRNINHHLSDAMAAKFSPSGQWVVSASKDNTIVVASAASGDKLVALRYRNSLLALDIASTPRGILMATGSETGDVNAMRFFTDADDLRSYTTSVLRDIEEPPELAKTH